MLREGNSVQWTNGGSAVVKGDVVVLGDCIGVAGMDIAASAIGTVYIEGVFALPKVDAAVIGIGEALKWDVSAGKFDDKAATPATGDITAGAVSVVVLGTTTDANIRVKLTPGAGTVT